MDLGNERKILAEEAKVKGSWKSLDITRKLVNHEGCCRRWWDASLKCTRSGAEEWPCSQDSDVPRWCRESDGSGSL